MLKYRLSEPDGSRSSNGSAGTWENDDQTDPLLPVTAAWAAALWTGLPWVGVGTGLDAAGGTSPLLGRTTEIATTHPPTGVPFSAIPTVYENQLTAATYGSGQSYWPTYGSNITAAWKTTAGQGVSIALLDDGFTPQNIANFNSALSKSFGAAGIAEPSGDYHGTTTSGLIGADVDGIVGLANGAGIIGVKVPMGVGPFATFVSALAYAGASASVVSNSWGFSGFNPGVLTAAFYSGWSNTMAVLIARDRGGLGDVVVFAAGNDRANNDNIGVQPIQDDPHVIAVAASDVDGLVASYSDPGAGLLVAAIGDNVAVPMPQTNSYTIASGTSYAAPTVAAIAAMMLSVNPGLTWRDVQEILAQSAYAPAPSMAGFAATAGRGWNGGGMLFSNDLGFGVVDAEVAVNLAAIWTGQLTNTHLVTTTVAHAAGFRIASSTPAASTLIVSAPLRLEHVQLTLNTTGLPLADTRIVLISPSGTQSVVLNDTGLVNGRDTSGGLALGTATMDSNAFWGESASGQWTLEVQDSAAHPLAVVTNWSLTFWGDTGATVATPLVYTPEFAELAAVAPWREAVSNAGMATTTIDLIDLPGATAINLNGGPGTIDGVAVQVAPGLLNLNANGSTGTLNVTTAGAGSAVTGGDGPTSVTGGGGADTITARAGATSVSGGSDTSMTFVAGAGGSTVYGGAGQYQLTDGPGNDVLVLQDGSAGGYFSISGFAIGYDEVEILGYGSNAPYTAQHGATSDGHGGMLVQLSDGTRIDFVGMAAIPSSIA
jgi:subtilisin-like proprotein convertase family protein